MARTIKTVSLFCGCGGMDLGIIGGFNYLGKRYSKLPFQIIKAVDNDPFCTKIYNENFKTKCDICDVRDLNSTTLEDFDLLVGGFPCQSFSISAQNPPRLGYKDDNGRLFFEMVRLLKEKRPRAFIAENVKGLLSANRGKAFPMIMNEFENAGYHVVYKLLITSDYGVPQRRERIIIVGFNRIEDFTAFKYPNIVQTNHVLRDVIEESANTEEKWFFSENAVAGMMNVREKMNKGRIQDLNKPCNTISCHLAKVSLNSTDPVLFINGRYRRFTPTEAAKIQSFPDSFLFGSVSEAKQYKAIGNAVPPVMMWHVAKKVAEAMR
jgi:DNA (cytosine-5)-methyltransferase 1